MEWLLKRLENVNTLAGAATLFGVPVSVVMAAAAAIWARIEHLRWSYVALILLAVFALALWSWIGILWLYEKARSKPAEVEKPKLDCAWGIAIDGGFLGFDAVGPIGCQITLLVRNLLQWPLRCEILQHTSNVDGVIPNMKVGGSKTIVIMQGTSISIGFDGYNQGTISQKSGYKGKIEIHIKYGHPDIGMSREMIRTYDFDVQLHPHPFQMLIPQHLGGPTPPLTGKFPLILGHSKDEVDKPL